MGEIVGSVSEIFNNENFTLRTLKQNGRVYFSGHDVAAGLGYQNTARAIATHVPDKYKVLSTIPNRYGAPNQGGALRVYISRPGLSLFIQRSKMPTAERFTEWVNEEVLESIYETGRYTSDKCRQFDQITDGVTRDSEDCPQLRKKAREFLDRTKNEDCVKRGSKGGNAFWRKHYKMEEDNAKLEKENRLLRQTKMEDYFPYAS